MKSFQKYIDAFGKITLKK